ncbi:MAG: DUF5663 domain-containing protein [Acidobacteriaceae bacterium]
MDKNIVNENLIKILGIESLPAEQKVKIVDQASELAEKRVFARILESLSDDKRQGLQGLLETGDELSINNFLIQNCPQFADWLTEEIATVKQELSGLAKTE